MSAADVPVGTLQFSSSMPSIDELLHQYEARSAWKLVSMPNLTMLCHEHKCDKCSTCLEHLLIAAHAGELCARPNGLKSWLDHTWPAVMDEIHKDVSEPLARKLDVACDLCDTRDDEIDCCRQTINDLHDQLDAEHHLRCRLKEKLAKYKGKQKEELEATMDSPLPHKHQAVGVPPPPMLPAVYMPADIPAEVAIPPPQQSTGIHAVPLKDDSTIDLFNRYYMSESNPDEAPDPLKRRSKNTKLQGGTADRLEPHPAKMQDVDMGPVVGQGADTRPVEKQGTTTHPAAKQGTKQRPVVSLPMSITGQLPRPLGKVAAIHAIRPLQWHDKCETTDPQFMEVATITCNMPAANHNPEQCGVYHRY